MEGEGHLIYGNKAGPGKKFRGEKKTPKTKKKKRGAKGDKRVGGVDLKLDSKKEIGRG